MTRPLLLDLPHGHQTVIDDDDLVLVAGVKLYLGTNGYVYHASHPPGTLHRLLMQPPSGTHVDHINGDKLDNRRANLRVVSFQRNQINRKSLNSNNTSGVRGVTYRADCTDRPWLAQITVNRQNRYLGAYSTLEDAIAVRRQAELDLFGELCP